MAKAPRPKHYTKKQQSRVEKEHLQRRMVLISTILIAVVVVLVIGYGVLDQTVLQQTKPVAKVEGQKITLEEFQARARYDRYQLIQNTALLEQYKQIFNFDQNSASYYDNYIQQNVALLNDSESLGNRVIEELVNDRVIAMQAEEMGLTVSEEEIDKSIQEAFGFYKDGTPTPAPTDAPYATATYSPLQMTLVPPTSTPSNTPTASVTPTGQPTNTPEPPTATPTLTELAPTATEGPTETPLPSATAYTEEGFAQEYQNYASTLELEAQFSPEEFRDVFRARTLYLKVLDEVTKDISKVEPYIWARHILVASEEEAKAVVDRLNSGETFVALAAELSTDTSNKDQGGDLSWFSKGVMDPAFEEAAFALTDIGQISEPVQSTFGWHIIQLLGKEDRPMTADRLETAKQDAFAEWLTSVKEGLKIETFDNWKTRVPTIPTTPAQYVQ